jgi:hypothetical protein
MQTTYDLKPLIGEINEEQLVKLVQDRRQHSHDYYRPSFSKTRSRYDLYRGIYSGRFASYRNSVHIPLLFSVCWSDVARKVQTSFNQYPYVRFQGLSFDDGPVAGRNERLVNAQLEDADSFRKAVDFAASADIYGTSIAQIGWTTLTQQRKWRVRVHNTELEEKGLVTSFDGPDWEVVDILDFYPQPGKKFIQDMLWCMRRYFVDYDDLVEMNAGPFPMFDQGAVTRLKQQPIGGTEEKGYMERWGAWRNFSEYQSRMSEPYGKPVELLDMWGLVPQEFARDGVRNRVVTVANGRVVLRNVPSPFWHGRKPFKSYCPMPDPHYFHGSGKIEIGEKLQVTANRLINQKLDALDMFIDPMFIASESTGLTQESLISKPGKVILVDADASPASIQPLIPNLQGLQAATVELEAIWRFIQQGTGIIEDTVQGAGGGGRQTAREFLGRQEAVLSRLNLEALLFEKSFVEPLADEFRDLNRQFLTVPKKLRILGTGGSVDPDTGLPIPPEPENVDLNDLSPDYRARAQGASRMISKAARQQAFVAALQGATANPALLQLTNWANFGRQYYAALDLDPMELINSGQVPQLNQQAMGQQGLPDEAAIAQMEQQGQGQQEGQGGPISPSSQGGPDVEQAMQMMMGG